MKAFLIAVVAVALIAAAAALAFSTQQRSSAHVYSTESTRVGDPGQNLLMMSPRGGQGRRDDARG